MKKKSVFRKLLFPIIFLSKFALIYTFISILVILFFRVINPSATAFILANSDFTFSSLFILEDIQYKPVSIQNVSVYVPLAVIASEDQRFFNHFGFDFEQIEKAMKENQRRRRVRGASTITMQTAKNLFLWSDKSLVRKGLEGYYTLLLEMLWSKQRILEVYLNIAEMGKGIYGIHKAAEIYYKKSPAKLTIQESATIAAILPNPKRRNPAKPSGYVIGRRSRIIDQMNLIGGQAFIKENIN